MDGVTESKNEPWVLVVEDDAKLREELQDALRTCGYPSRAAEHGREAWNLLFRLPDTDLPGLILLDLMLPVMDGWELLQRLQENERLGGIPVIVTTPLTSEYRRHNTARATGYLTRPLELESLATLLRDHLAR